MFTALAIRNALRRVYNLIVSEIPLISGVGIAAGNTLTAHSVSAYGFAAFVAALRFAVSPSSDIVPKALELLPPKMVPIIQALIADFLAKNEPAPEAVAVDAPAEVQEVVPSA